MKNVNMRAKTGKQARMKAKKDSLKIKIWKLKASVRFVPMMGLDGIECI